MVLDSDVGKTQFPETGIWDLGKDYTKVFRYVLPIGILVCSKRIELF